MYIKNNFKGFAQQLFAELPNVKRLALSLFPELTTKIWDKAMSNVTLYFDVTHKPEIKGNTQDIGNLLDEVFEKYENSEDKEERIFSENIKYNRNRFSHEGDNNLCGEGLLSIFDASRWPENRNICKDITRIKRQILKTYLGGKIVGYYFHKDKRIVLYTKHLDPNRYESFLSVFVHEVFHAVHRFYLDENGCCENLSEYYHAVVLESLATYFQINYLRYRGFSEKAEEIEENVFRHSPIFYPKSGCKECFNYNRVFNEALDWTKDDFEQALRKLVNKYDADIIMQKENYIIYDEVILKNKKKTDVSLPDERQAKENISENSNNKKNDSNRIGSALDILKSVFYGEWECDSDKTGDDCIFVNGKKIHLYIAGQTLNYRIESQRGHLYAPQKGYPTMLDVNPGDIIFSYRNGKIVSINVALAAENTYGTEDGLRIECIYSELTTPLDIKYIRQNIAGLKPFYGHGCLPRRGYIHHLSSSAARIMMKEIKKLGNRPR